MSNLEKLRNYPDKNATIKKNLLYGLAALSIFSGAQFMHYHQVERLESECQKVQADAVHLVDSLILKNAAEENMKIVNINQALNASLATTKKEISVKEFEARKNNKYAHVESLRRAFNIRKNQIDSIITQKQDIMPLIYTMEKNAGRTLESFKVVSTLPAFEQKLRAFIAKSK